MILARGSRVVEDTLSVVGKCCEKFCRISGARVIMHFAGSLIVGCLQALLNRRRASQGVSFVEGLELIAKFVS